MLFDIKIQRLESYCHLCPQIVWKVLQKFISSYPIFTRLRSSYFCNFKFPKNVPGALVSWILREKKKKTRKIGFVDVGNFRNALRLGEFASELRATNGAVGRGSRHRQLFLMHYLFPPQHPGIMAGQGCCIFSVPTFLQVAGLNAAEHVKNCRRIPARRPLGDHDVLHSL